MEDFRLLFHKIISFLGVYGSEAEALFKTFFDQVYANFVDGLLKDKLPQEVYDNRLEEYKSYIKEGKQELLHKDLSFYLGDDATKGFAKEYMRHLRNFIHGMHAGGSVTKEQVEQVGNLVQQFITSKRASTAMRNEASSIDSLKAIA